MSGELCPWWCPGHWGYCSPNCTGQLPTSGSASNLARPLHSTAWEENLYHMDPYGAGHCHTYNPPREAAAGFRGQLYALLGRSSFSLDEFYLGYNIYLHEAGQFWPSDDLQLVGQTQALHLAPGRQWEGQFTVSRETNIRREQWPCAEDDGYSYTACIVDHVDRYTGCHLDWFGPAAAAAALSLIHI